MIILVIVDGGTPQIIGPFISNESAFKFAGKIYPNSLFHVCTLEDKKSVFNKRRKTLAQRLEEAKT